MLTRAERLAGPERCATLLDGSVEDTGAFEWFAAANDGALAGDGLLAEALRAWGRVVDDPNVMAWWERAHSNGKPALPRQLLRDAPMGVVRIDLSQKGTWVPADGEQGAPAIIYCDMAPGLDGEPGQGVDLIAMDPLDKRRWRRRTELCGVLPSDDAVRAIDLDARLRLYEHPLDWLAAGMPYHSMCILDWTCSAARDLLRLIDDEGLMVVCDSHRHGRAVKRLARPPKPALRILVEKPIWTNGG